MDKRLRHLPALRCFDAAARHQSYSRAAEELAITQAAVSQQIRGLEQALGAKLFARDGRQMKLTARGHSLARHVTEAFNQVLDGFNSVQCESEPGVLTVTTTGSFASMWLMPRLWKFSRLHPDIAVRVMASVQVEDLRRSDIDLAIRQGEIRSDELEQEFIINEPVFAVCSRQLQEELDLQQPHQIIQCLLVEGHDPGRFSWRHWFELAGLDYQAKTLRMIEVHTLEMCINAVAAGQGVCLSSYSLAGEMMRRGVLVKPFDIEITPGFAFSLLNDPDSPRLARIEVFKAWLKQELASTPPLA